MHELSIASAIADQSLEFAESFNPPKKILGVRVLIGELSCIEPEQLKFCYDAITKETVARRLRSGDGACTGRSFLPTLLVSWAAEILG